MFCFNKMVGPKTNLVPKNLVQKILGPHKFWVQKSFWSTIFFRQKAMLSQKNIGFTKMFGQKKFWVQTFLTWPVWFNHSKLNMTCHNSIWSIPTLLALSWFNIWSKFTLLVLTGLDQSWLHLTCPNLICPDLTCPDSTKPDLSCPDLTCPDLTCTDLICPDLPFKYI